VSSPGDGVADADEREREELLDRLDALVARVDQLPGEAGDTARGLAEALYVLHHSAVGHLAAALGEDGVDHCRRVHPAVAWLFDVYGEDLEVAAGTGAGGAVAPPPGARVLPVVGGGPT
jgi:hypothetical protein